MNCKYLLLVILKNNNTESYYADDKDELIKYADFRKFKRYEIYKLEKVVGSDSLC